MIYAFVSIHLYAFLLCKKTKPVNPDLDESFRPPRISFDVVIIDLPVTYLPVC